MKKSRQGLNKVIKGLDEVISGHGYVDLARTHAPKVVDAESSATEGFRITLDGRNAARVEITAFGQKIVAIVVAQAEHLLQRIVLAIRGWCMTMGYEPIA